VFSVKKQVAALARQGKLAAATAELRQVLAMDPQNEIARESGDYPRRRST